MDGTRERMNWQLRAGMVWDTIAEQPKPVSIAEICALTGLKRTPYLGDILNWLTARNYLAYTLMRGDKGHAQIVYWAQTQPDLTDYTKP